MKDIRQKKILMTLMRLDIGGAETHVLELSLELKRKGFDVVVASGGGVYEQHLACAGIKHYNVPMYTKSPDKMMRSLGALKKIIWNEKIDIVHAHGRIPAFLCGILNKFMPFTFVTTAHWVFRTGYGFKYLSNWGQKVMAVSEDIKTYLMDNYGTFPGDIYVTINGIDTGRFSPETDFSALLEEFSLSPDSKKIVYISRMDEDRALVAFQLVHIAAEIEKICPGVEIVIVGGGNVFDKLVEETKLINEKAGRKLITLAGARTDIDRFCAMADLFVGVSRSALEAMACAKPVIVAGNEGYLGIFDEDKLQVGIDTNFCCRGLVSSTEELLLRDAISVLQAEDFYYQHLCSYARQTICDYYSVSKMAMDSVEMYCAAVEEKKWDAVISGYYGYGNSGDEALLCAMISHLRMQKPDVRLCVLSKNPSQTMTRHGVYAINRYRYGHIKKALKHAKLFISGGGSLLQDVTSSKSLWYYLSLIRMAQKIKTPVMLYANGIGPIRKENNQVKVSKILDKVDVITLRDPDSKQELIRIGSLDEKILITADPALTIQPAEANEIDSVFAKEQIPLEKKYLGISVRKWHLCESNFKQKFADAITELCKAKDLTPVFIPMQFPDDYHISKDIEKYLGVKGYTLSGVLDADKTIGVISRMKIMLAMRLHSLIYAVNVHVPTVGLSYDPKIDGFMDYISTGKQIPVENFEPEKLIAAFNDLYDQYDEIVHTMKRTHKKLQILAHENAEIAFSMIKKWEGNYTYETDGN